MAKRTLANGVNIIINNRLNGVDTPIYPITKTSNIFDGSGIDLDTVIESLAKKEHGNHVPDYSSEIVSDVRFLRNDNTWANIQSASATQPGIVKVTDEVTLDASDVAASAKAVKGLKEAIDNIDVTIGSDYVKKTQLGSATSGDNVGVATLDENGYIPEHQLPSFVDDVIEVAVSEDRLSATDKDGQVVTPESGKIYVDCIGELATQKTFRWTGSRYGVVSDTITIGETSSTAFDGARGKVAYDHSQAEHARVDATKTEASSNNGYVKVNGTDVLVYTHPEVAGGSSTNPHGTTKEDIGLGNVENKSAATILDEITEDLIVEKLGYTPSNSSVAASTTQDGYMSKEMVSKLNGCMEMSVSADAPTFTAGTGIWFQIVE